MKRKAFKLAYSDLGSMFKGGCRAVGLPTDAVIIDIRTMPLHRVVVITVVSESSDWPDISDMDEVKFIKPTFLMP